MGVDTRKETDGSRIHVWPLLSYQNHYNPLHDSFVNLVSDVKGKVQQTWLCSSPGWFSTADGKCNVCDIFCSQSCTFPHQSICGWIENAWGMHWWSETWQSYCGAPMVTVSFAKNTCKPYTCLCLPYLAFKKRNKNTKFRETTRNLDQAADLILWTTAASCGKSLITLVELLPTSASLGFQGHSFMRYTGAQRKERQGPHACLPLFLSNRGSSDWWVHPCLLSDTKRQGCQTHVVFALGLSSNGKDEDIKLLHDTFWHTKTSKLVHMDRKTERLRLVCLLGSSASRSWVWLPDALAIFSANSQCKMLKVSKRHYYSGDKRLCCPPSN